MAPRSQPVLAFALPLAVLLSSCLLLTDTEVAEPLPEDQGIEDVDGDGNAEDPFEDPIADPETDTDGGEDTAGDLRDLDTTPTDRDVAEDVDTRDSGPENGELRCVNRTVETYDGELEAWEETEICAYEERCVDGACVDRPEDFGEECDGVEDCPDEEVTCRGGLCLTRAPSEDGGPCIGDEECAGGLICSRRGVCQDGGPGDDCVDADDCDPNLAPFCEDDACVPAGVGEACTSDETCESDTLYCDPDGFCRAGLEGDPCADDLQCAKTGRYCGPDEQCHNGSTGDACDTTADCVEDNDICKGTPITTCWDRAEGDPCTEDAHCPVGLYCAASQSECRDGSTDDHCDTTSDCDELDDICKGEPDTTCQDRIVDDACSGDDDECPGDLYCANGLCQAGGTGAYCDTTADCTEIDDICAGSPLVCRDRVLGDACAANDDECPGTLYCANALCQAGDTGQFCNITDDCVDVVNICKGSPARCQKRVEGDACGVPEDCPDTAPICSAGGVCQDGSVGDDCEEHDDCDEANHCDEATDKCAEDLELAANCSDDYQCASDNCSNDHCAPLVDLGGGEMSFAYIPPGTFCMGSPGGGDTVGCSDGAPELGRDDTEGPLHQVTLTHPFYLQETEVTQRQWSALFPDANPSYFTACELDCPVEQVTWWEAAAYLNALSAAEDLEACYTFAGCDAVDPGDGMVCTGISIGDPDAAGRPYLCEGYRFPTEAEWEYAYRAETRTAFHNGGITHTERTPLDENLDLIGWYRGNSGVDYSPGFDCSRWGVSDQTTCGTHEVGGKAANDWGLYDMSGNVWEWVWDWYQSDYYASLPPSNPLGGTGSYRVLRGGSWASDAQYCRAAFRVDGGPGGRFYFLGFRPARSVLTTCVSNDDCAGLTPICGPTGICQSGHENEPCDSVAHCTGSATICSTAGICQDGDEGDACSTTEDCGAEAAICSTTGVCQDGSEGDACTDGGDCTSGQCSNDHCAPEGWAYIPPGTFCMGSPGGGGSDGCPDDGDPEPGRQPNEGPLHQVTLTRPYLMQETEVTREQWRERFPGNDPSWLKACGLDCPVEQVSWWETIAYLNALSAVENLDPCYELIGCNPTEAGTGIPCTDIVVLGNGNPYDCQGYRLPTEAEWEYAYRAGTMTTFHNGGIEYVGRYPLDENLDQIGWYGGNSEVEYEVFDCTAFETGADWCGTHTVGGKAANDWGLHDMSGNVFELVWDGWGQYSPSAEVDPLNNAGSLRTHRGGSWHAEAYLCRGAVRGGLEPAFRDAGIGFRPARTIWPPHCSNNVRDGDESAVDCGGSCPSCGLAQDCHRDSDCASGNCSNAHCSLVVEIGDVDASFAYIPPGTFCMGSPGGGGSDECPDDGPAELGRDDDEGPLHQVTLTRGFYLQETEVTQGQWLAAIPGDNPSYFTGCELDCPIDMTNWWGTVAYANALSEHEGLEPCYTLEGCDPSLAGSWISCDRLTVSDPDASGNPYLCEGYRLPTEAEWEYAYRAGTTTPFYNGGITHTGTTPLEPNLDAIGWYSGNSSVGYSPARDCSTWGTGATLCGTHEVGTKAPNAWGLYDMSGNVHEFLWDWRHSYSADAVTDPIGAHEGSGRVTRGGGWHNSAQRCRAAARQGVGPTDYNYFLGFRLARTVPTPCADNDDCGGVRPICGPRGTCHAGREGDDCSGAEHCNAEAPICASTGVCQDGGEGDGCTVVGDCAEGQCSNDHCAPEGWAYIPPGTFCMGSPDGETACMGETPEAQSRDTDELLHEVTLTRPILIQETEVTQGQWLERFPVRNPSAFYGCGLDCPVDSINWWEATAYANALSESEGLEPCYELTGCTGAAGVDLECTGITVNGADGNPYGCEGYRLATEAEWEYACRAGTTTAFYNGDITFVGSEPLDESLNVIGWYRGNSGVSYAPGFDCTGWYSGSTVCGSHPVTTKVANDWGLFDMAGSVQEWVWDMASEYPSIPTENPLGGTGSLRVFRGGSWSAMAHDCRAANRTAFAPNYRDGSIGLRLARTLWPPHCLNDLKDGDESAIDCGGSCAGCGLAEACLRDADCASDNCSNDRCAPLVEIGDTEAAFAYIPPGTFCMGSPGGGGSEECPDGMPELGRNDDEGPLHQVTLTRGFYLQETEVTQREWIAAGFSNPSRFTECGADCPVEKVNWWETMAYANALSVAEGLEPCYALDGCDPAQAGIGNGIACNGATVTDPDACGVPYLCEGYRLPTEAEWEYAYRAGTTTALYNGELSNTGCHADANLDAIAWHCENSAVTHDDCDNISYWGGPACAGSHPVGHTVANAWGLHDMAGNVWEWIWDGYAVYTSAAVADPLGPTGPQLLLRGGSYAPSNELNRAANRNSQASASYRECHVGFRVARSVLTTCDTNDDCGGFTPICGPTGICQAGHENEPCSSVAHCTGDATICSTTGICQDGSEGDACSNEDDCGAEAAICSTAGICQDGSEGDACTDVGDCAARQCSNGHCAPEGWAYIPPGTFCMGSPDGETECMGETPVEEDGRATNEALHEVTLTRPFLMQATEVTQWQWLEFFPENNPWYFGDCGLDCPAHHINWWEAVAYLNALSATEGREPCYTLEGCDPSLAGIDITCTGITVSDPNASGDPYLCEGYRLPMETEWEYAYRARTRTAFFSGGITYTDRSPLDTNLDSIGWYGGNSGVTYAGEGDCTGWYSGSTICGIHPVARKEPNAWDLFDMSGNVWEWVWDYYHEDYYASSPYYDPLGPAEGSQRSARGGTWFHFAKDCRAATRMADVPEMIHGSFGIRPARTIWPPHCSNDVQDGDESAIDCGGSCPGCGLAEACYRDADCASDNCSNAHCAPLVELGETEARFAYIPAGTFCMGSPDGSTECMGETRPSEEYRLARESLHEVTLTRGFFLQETEVTQGQWEALGFADPSCFDYCGLDCPVEGSNWWETVAFLNALSEAEGLETCYELTGCTGTAGVDLACTGVTVNGIDEDPYDCEGYRLPTEAEWEYAARGGTTTAFYNGRISHTDRTPLDENADAIGWYGGNSGVSYLEGEDCTEWDTGASSCGTHQTGLKAPNAWGLFDMSGNVWEWVWDWYGEDYYESSPNLDPLGPPNADHRVSRGGSWYYGARWLRSADRYATAPGDRFCTFGFRVARTAP